MEPARLTTPRLTGAQNFRDVAGTATTYSLEGGTRLADGVVYRSNALDRLTDEDMERIADLDVRTVIDLRSDEEIEGHEDVLPQGVEWVHVDVMGRGDTAVNPLRQFDVDTPEAAAQALASANVAFVEDANQREAFRDAIRVIAEADGAVLFHCTAGKDRAGWLSAVLQLAAGVDEADVTADYLASNEYNAAWMAETGASLAEQYGEDMGATYAVLLGVQEEFLAAGLEAMTAQYGGIEGYLRDGLGLDAGTVDALKRKLTV
ncbi:MULTISPECIES: tyrosine-protein phosphatase [unclassified Microbacterium]|uniref:tyrosine-protein phosphatase n=1 Tax=unclassified Microbacterium TaxID=2609290 RepID=UPI003010597C